MIASVLTAPEITQLGSTVENAIILAAEGGFILLFMAMLRMGKHIDFWINPVSEEPGLIRSVLLRHW
jgi:hypothetical protein